MATLNLKARYFVDSTPENVPCREENFIRRELVFPLPVQRTALVLVDLWNKHHIESWIERASKMAQEVIVPLINRARETGIAVVFAPSPGVIREVPGKYHVYPGTGIPEAATAIPKATWPPAEFIDRRGEFELYRGPRSQNPPIRAHWPKTPIFDLAPCISVQEEDYVIATGDQLHDLCTELGVFHILFAGFATNWCILNRDYGVVHMRARGYNTMLMRDATEGVEFPDTLADRWATEIAIREVEQRHGFSVSNDDFYDACRFLDDE